MEKKETKLLCPFCKHDHFLRSEKDTLICIIDDGETLRDEYVSTDADEFIYKCAKCKKEVTEEELARE